MFTNKINKYSITVYFGDKTDTILIKKYSI